MSERISSAMNSSAGARSGMGSEVFKSAINYRSQGGIQRVLDFNLGSNTRTIIVVTFPHHRWCEGIVMHGRIVILSGIILRVLQQGLKETMTVVTEIKTNGVLVYGMSRGVEFAKWGTQPFVSIVGVDSIVSDCSSWCGTN